MEDINLYKKSVVIKRRNNKMTSLNKNSSVYCLKLEQNKYYIGRSGNPRDRIQKHFDGFGSQWTKKYKPIRIFEIIPNCVNFDEEKYTFIYMEKYGIENVRGGSFCQINLSDDDKRILNKIIKGSKDVCFKCGEKGHFIRQCPSNKTELSENTPLIYNKPKKKSFKEKFSGFLNSLFECFEPDLSSKYGEIDLSSLEDDPPPLKKKTKFYGKSLNRKYKCNRCGRYGHTYKKCYAKTHISTKEKL